MKTLKFVALTFYAGTVHLMPAFVISFFAAGLAPLTETSVAIGFAMLVTSALGIAHLHTLDDI
jgi:hypothetical protein